MPVSPEDFKKMEMSICPTCNMPMFKNGKRTHSKYKAVVCEAKFREKCQVLPDEQYVTIDGVRYLIDANFKRNQK